MKNYKYLEGVALISQVGLNILVPILLCTYIGNRLDEWLGTRGIFLTIFILLGVGAGFYNLLKLAKKK